MLSSAAGALRYSKTTRKASWGLKSAQTSKKIVAKAHPSTMASSSRRSYAIMKHTDPYVAADYESAPTITIPARLRDSVAQQGGVYAKKVRKEHQLIPGVINRGNIGKPMLIEMDPLLITYLMQSNTSRFLGRRYYVDIEGLAKYEVFPQNLDVEPIGYHPKAVTFGLWSGPKTAPKPTLPPHVVAKFFEPLQEFPPIEEQQKQRDEGTYKYTRFMANTIQREVGHPLK